MGAGQQAMVGGGQYAKPGLMPGQQLNPQMMQQGQLGANPAMGGGIYQQAPQVPVGAAQPLQMGYQPQSLLQQQPYGNVM
jgi:hypothetical protein